MQIVTDSDATHLVEDAGYTRITYADGSVTMIPSGFAQGGDGAPWPGAVVYAGKNALIGVGSTARYDFVDQSLRIGRYVSGGMRLRFILNATHGTNTITTWGGPPESGLPSRPGERYGDTTIGNDVWIGDEAMFLGGATVADGCVIGARSLVPPNAVLEPYGVYVGHPARLIRFRFHADIIERLLRLRWWNAPIAWIRENTDLFGIDLNADHARSLAMLDALSERPFHATPSSSSGEK